MQRTWLEYLRSRGIGSTLTRFKDSEDNRIHKSVLLPYKVGAMATKLWTRGSDHVVSDGTFAHDDNTRFGQPPAPAIQIYSKVVFLNLDIFHHNAIKSCEILYVAFLR